MVAKGAPAVVVTALLVLSAAVGAALPARPSGAAPPAVSVTVSCATNPEKVTVKNNRTSSITVRTVGSIYQPYSFEPVTVTRTLAAGVSVTFQSGGAASANVLTKRYIFNNDVGSTEGARAATSAGTFEKRCA